MYGLCFTEWTDEFMGSYSNYIFMSHSIFNIMALWSTLCSHPTLKRFFVFHFLFPCLVV